MVDITEVLAYRSGHGSMIYTLKYPCLAAIKIKLFIFV